MSPADVTAALSCGRPGCPCARGKVVHCPAHDDLHPSLSVSKAEGKVLFHCQAGCSQEAVIAALRARGLWPGGAPKGSVSPRPTAKRIVTRYSIRRPDGKVVAVHVRRDGPAGKSFSWEAADGQAGLDGTPMADLPLYGSERLGELTDGAAVVVVEGEKAAQALHVGHPAVGTVTGANGTPGLEALRPLARLAPILWPDNDAPGLVHMNRIGARLREMGCPVRLVEWAEAPPGGDAADAVAQGADISALLQGAQPLALAEAQNLATLLTDVKTFIRRYIVVGEAELAALALWIAHTWAFEAAECTPYLHVTSPEPTSGKTRLLEVLDLMVARPWFTARVSAAVLVRRVARDAPTLLLDETDAAFKGEVDYAEALRGILNSGYRRGGAASLCVKAGGGYELVDFPTFCPKALAGIGRLPDTIANRSIRISMRRRLPTEAVARFRRREAKAQAAPLRERLEKWASIAIPKLADASVSIPDALSDRATDVWEPLLAIADAAGEPWSRRARETALALASYDLEDQLSLGALLLRDIGEMLKGKAGPIPSSELVASLVALEEAPWGDLKGRALDARGLARRLRAYGIRPRTVRVGDVTAKGYGVEDFADAFSRYAPYTPLAAVTTVTSVTNGAPEFTSEPANVTDVTDVTVPGGVCERPCVARLLALGAWLNWPRGIDLGRAERIAEGEKGWRTFAAIAPRDKLAKALAAAEALATELEGFE